MFDLKNFQFYSIFFVEFFFVLIGFVLFPQLQRIYINSKNTKIFYLRRWYRTIPPYIVALACYSIIFTKFDIDTLKYLFFIQKISADFVNYDYFSIAWSLSVEEFFYLIFPLFIVIFNKRKFIHIIIIFTLIIYVLKIIYLFLNVNEEFYRVGTFLRLDSIVFGAITRIYFDKIKNNYTNLLSAILIIISMNYFMFNLKNLTNYELFLFILLAQCLSINVIIIFINYDKFIVNKSLSSIFSLLSKQTYSIYLFHLAIIHIFNSNTFILNSKFIFLFYLISLFSFSSFFYYTFEKKIIESRPKYED